MEAKASCRCTGQWTCDNKCNHQEQRFAFNQRNEKKDQGNNVLGILFCRVGWPRGTQQGAALSFLHAFYRAMGDHTGPLHQMCDQEWTQQLGRQKVFCCHCSGRSWSLKDYRLLWPFCPELCLKLLWCQKMGSPCAGKSSSSKEHIDLKREKNQTNPGSFIISSLYITNTSWQSS